MIYYALRFHTAKILNIEGLYLLRGKGSRGSKAVVGTVLRDGVKASGVGERTSWHDSTSANGLQKADTARVAWDDKEALR